MRLVLGIFIAVIATVFASSSVSGQRMEICGEEWSFSGTPSTLNQSGVVYGRVSIEASEADRANLKVVVRMRDGQSVKQRSFRGSGTYCFEKSVGGGAMSGPSGEITVDVNGEQVESRSLIPNQPEQREDFRVKYRSGKTSAGPEVISAKFNYDRKSKNTKAFQRALAAISGKRHEEALKELTAIFEDDPADYIVAATLGSVYFQQQNFTEAAQWYKRSLDIRADFTPAWISLARSQSGAKEFDAAIESCKKAIALEPKTALAYYIMGEAYLRTDKANLGAEALTEAIKLDPIGMAECHLILADLFDLNGFKKLATKEYKAFIAKVPDHRDKARIKKYIADNPE